MQLIPTQAKRITLADVARRAGVHVTTVSLSMRNNRRIPIKTRQKLQALAKQMGYTPDPLLRALVAYRGQNMPRCNPPTVAYVTNWETRWGWKNITAHPQFYAGAQTKAQELGFKLDHFWLSEPGMTAARLSRILYTRGIKGVILASHSREMDDVLTFDWGNFSAVKIDYFPHRPALHNVTNNQCDIVRLAMRKLIDAGYRRIGFAMHRGWDHAVDRLWSAGFLCEQQALRFNERIPIHLFPGAEPVARWLNESKTGVEVEHDSFARWLKKHEPEVIISKESFVMPALKKLGLQVPRDLAFVDLFLEEFTGAKAGIRQNHETVGALAVEILAGQLHHGKFGTPSVATTTFVEGTWFDGLSCPARQSARAAAVPAVDLFLAAV